MCRQPPVVSIQQKSSLDTQAQLLPRQMADSTLRFSSSYCRSHHTSALSSQIHPFLSFARSPRSPLAPPFSFTTIILQCSAVGISVSIHSGRWLFTRNMMKLCVMSEPLPRQQLRFEIACGVTCCQGASKIRPLTTCSFGRTLEFGKELWR